MTILCKPLQPLSWSYFLEGGGHEAIWKKRLTSEQGSFLIDDIPFEVQKRGPGSGTWLLMRGDEIHSTARKTSAFRHYRLRFLADDHSVAARGCGCRRRVTGGSHPNTGTRFRISPTNRVRCVS